MEAYSNENDSQQEAFLSVSPEAKYYLSKTRKWTKFFAIMGFIGIGFLIIMALFVTTLFSGMPQQQFSSFAAIPTFFISLIYIVMAAIYFAPVMYLYKYSKHSNLALLNNSDDELTNTFKYMYKHYQYMGIVCIVIFSLYAFVIVGSIFAALAASAI